MRAALAAAAIAPLLLSASAGGGARSEVARHQLREPQPCQVVRHRAGGDRAVIVAPSSTAPRRSVTAIRMNLVQYYETVVRDNATSLAARLVVFPRRSLEGPGVIHTGSMEFREASETEHFLAILGAREILEVSPDKLLPILAGIITEMPQLSAGARGTEHLTARMYYARQLISGESLPLAGADLRFAEALLNEELVPFESSPLQAVSLAQLTKASGVATGAYIGFVIAGETPLLLITVPAGMMICGAAAGIGEGLRRRFEALLSKNPRVSRQRTARRKAKFPKRKR